MASTTNIPTGKSNPNPNSSSIYINPSAAHYTCNSSAKTPSALIQSFHTHLPSYARTPLTLLPQALSSQLGVGSIFAKDESTRFGLPAFKILGASWGAYRALCQRFNLKLELDPSKVEPSPLEKVGRRAREAEVVLFAATEGNFGRAVARMGRLLGVEVQIYVPGFTGVEVRRKIESEGAEVVVVQEGNYDDAVAAAWNASRDEKLDGRGMLVQDNAFEGYREIPGWVVEGYGSMMVEIGEQFAEREWGMKADVLVTPVGVGGLAHATVEYCKVEGRAMKVLAIEPDTAGGLHASLKAGENVIVRTGETIMDGMNCGTVSPTSWEVLKGGVDVSVTVSDWECHEAVRYLHENGVLVGPCGAGALAGLLKVAKEDPGCLGLGKESVIVLLCTEGEREYVVPKEPTIDGEK